MFSLEVCPTGHILSRYDMFFPADGRVICYNTLRGSLLTITKDNHLMLAEGGLQGIPRPLLLVLIEFGLAVPDDIDELAMFRYELYRTRFGPKSVAMTIAPTLDCNMRCTYCYETDVHRPMNMSRELEEAISTYFESRSVENSTLAIAWYGGEPLLMVDTVLRLTRQIREIADKKNCRFSGGMVTNGTHLQLQTKGLQWPMATGEVPMVFGSAQLFAIMGRGVDNHVIPHPEPRSAWRALEWLTNVRGLF